jgi:hypothetical protein
VRDPAATRRALIGLVLAAVVIAQVGLFVRNRERPHHVFAFQMFDESSEWKADVVRVTTAGRRVPVEEPWAGYRWRDLVPDRGLAFPSAQHHADSGMESTLDFLEDALDWVAANTPRDTETRYLEARVTYVRNTRGPSHVTLRSPERDVP